MRQIGAAQRRFSTEERESLQKLLDVAMEFQDDFNADPDRKANELTIGNLQGIVCAFIRFFNRSQITPP